MDLFSSTEGTFDTWDLKHCEVMLGFHSSWNELGLTGGLGTTVELSLISGKLTGRLELLGVCISDLIN